MSRGDVEQGEWLCDKCRERDEQRIAELEKELLKWLEWVSGWRMPAAVRAEAVKRIAELEKANG